MNDDRPYRILVERRPVPASATVVLPAGPDAPDVDELAVLLDALFADRPGVAAVALTHGGVAVGTVTRTRLHQLVEPVRTAAEGDGAGLPGESRRYQVLEYRCPQADCPQVEWHVVVPPGSPLCGSGHGALRHVR